jgi:hypothetical protein
MSAAPLTPYDLTIEPHHLGLGLGLAVGQTRCSAAAAETYFCKGESRSSMTYIFVLLSNSANRLFLYIENTQRMLELIPSTRRLF